MHITERELLHACTPHHPSCHQSTSIVLHLGRSLQVCPELTAEDLHPRPLGAGAGGVVGRCVGAGSGDAAWDKLLPRACS